MMNMQLPSWAYWAMGAGLACFIALVALSVRRHHGVKRSLFAAPYTLWMLVFTLLPCILIAYYAFTDTNGAFTLDNFRSFWDSNNSMRENLRALAGDEVAATVARGSVNVDTLVYSLWMAFLCTAISLLLGYPAALFMADRKMKMGSTIVVLFIIPMWMNFLLRTIAWMSLLEDNGLINAFLEWIGIGRKHLMYNQSAVLLGMVYNFLPFMVLPIYSVLVKLDRSLVEAAADLGANPITCFVKVVLPQSVPGIISGITMVFIPAITTFAISRLLGGGKFLLYGDLIENQFITLGQSAWPVGSALSFILLILVLLSMAVMRRAERDSGDEGGMLW